MRFRLQIDCQFVSTLELCDGKESVGQDRALAALELGLGVSATGYNIFVSNLNGTEKLDTIRSWVTERAAKAPTPGDWVYVHNFPRPDSPRAIYLDAGAGSRLRQLMHQLVRTLKEELPKAFRQEAFDKEKTLLNEKYNARTQEMNAQFAALARQRGFLIQTGARGNIYLFRSSTGSRSRARRTLID